MIQNETILIRAIEPEDLEYLYKWENDMELWDISETLTPFSYLTLKKYIENSHRDIYDIKQVRLIIVKREDMTPVGTVELFDFDPHHQRAGIGIMVYDKTNQKKGYAKAAIKMMLYYAFEKLSLHQVFCHVPISNVPSLNLFKSIGFEHSGTFTQWIKKGDKWEDVAFMQMLVPNWRNSKK